MLGDIHVSILGRNELVREGLRRILIDQGFVVEAAVSDTASLIEATTESDRPHLIIVDSHTDPDTLDTCRFLHERFSGSHIVLMADGYTIENVALALSAGVDGYLVKAISCEPLGGALRLIALGEKVIPTPVVDSLVAPVWRTAPGDWQSGKIELNLSDREIEILRCLITGDANKIIARRLDITEATVKVHIKAILRKLRVMNRTQAAIWAVTRGLNQEEPAVQSPPAWELPAHNEMLLKVANSH